MAIIEAFSSVRYNERLLAHAENLMTPPYDVISADDQEFYYDQNPFNVIRLILGKEFPDDTDRNNRYTRARDFLNNWTRDGPSTVRSTITRSTAAGPWGSNWGPPTSCCWRASWCWNWTRSAR